jgi:hypothetical protein
MSGRKRKGAGTAPRPKRSKHAAAVVPLAAPAAAATPATEVSGSTGIQEKEEEPQILGGVKDLYHIVASYAPRPVYICTIVKRDYEGDFVKVVSREFQSSKAAHAYAVCALLTAYYMPFPEDEKKQNDVYFHLKSYQDKIMSVRLREYERRTECSALYKFLVGPNRDSVEIENWFKFIVETHVLEKVISVKECKAQTESEMIAELATDHVFPF